jgi:excisionase family DNA binding protein
MENPNSLLTVKETAAYLRMPLPSVYFNINKGIIPAIRIGNRYRIKQVALDALLNQPTVSKEGLDA